MRGKIEMEMPNRIVQHDIRTIKELRAKKSYDVSI